MIRSFRMAPAFLAALGLLAGLVFGPAARAQGPDGPPPGAGGPPPPGRGGPPPASAATTPLEMLTAGLNLTAAQKTKVGQIQQQFQQQRQALLPQPGATPPATPPDPQTMHTAMDKVRTLDQQASESIKAVLSDAQKKALPALLTEVNTLRQAGIPPDLLGDLKLTAAQKAQIATVVQAGQQEMRKDMDAARKNGDFSSLRDTLHQVHTQTMQKAMAVLNDTQKAQVEKFKQSHPLPPPPGNGPPPPGDMPPPPGDMPPPPGDIPPPSGS